MLVPHGRLDLMQRVVQLYSPPRPRRDGDVNWTSYWYAAIKAACGHGDLRMVKWLVEHHYGREICVGNRADVDHDHFLCIAAEEGHVDVKQYLFDEGADGQYPDSLLRAVRKGHLNSMKWLLEHHSYVELRDGERVIEEAARNGRLEILEVLHDLDSSVATGKYSSATTIDRKKSADTRAWWSQAYSTMDVAASNGHLDVVQWLHLNRPKTCSVNAMDDAAANGHLDVVKWLHANRSEGCSRSAVDIAASNGHLEVIQWLLTNTRTGCTTLAMDLAARNGHLEVIKWLYKNSTKGCTANAFENAIEHSHVRVAWWIQEHYHFGVPETMTVHAPNQFDIVLFLFTNYPDMFMQGSMERPRLIIISGPNDEIVSRWVQATEPGITLHAL